MGKSHFLEGGFTFPEGVVCQLGAVSFLSRGGGGAPWGTLVLMRGFSKKIIGLGGAPPPPMPPLTMGTLTSVKSVQTYHSGFFIANFEQTSYIVHASAAFNEGDIQNFGKRGKPYMGGHSILWGGLITS